VAHAPWQGALHSSQSSMLASSLPSLSTSSLLALEEPPIPHSAHARLSISSPTDDAAAVDGATVDSGAAGAAVSAAGVLFDGCILDTLSRSRNAARC